jgi:WD40 repeat protein
MAIQRFFRAFGRGTNDRHDRSHSVADAPSPLSPLRSASGSGRPPAEHSTERVVPISSEAAWGPDASGRRDFLFSLVNSSEMFASPRFGLVQAAALGHGCPDATAVNRLTADPDDSASGGGRTPANMSPHWRIKPSSVTKAAGLVLCLNIGTDPPDAERVEPCARLESWTDPSAFENPQEALRVIGKEMLGAWRDWFDSDQYSVTLDPTSENVQAVALALRRAAGHERALLHINGHGVPSPTPQGELWAFDAQYTQYVPISVHLLKRWLQPPAMIVLDSSRAGAVIPHFLSATRITTHASADDAASSAPEVASTDSQPRTGEDATPTTPVGHPWMVLAACTAEETLPVHPSLPADLFTSCLLTPVRTSLHCHILQKPHTVPSGLLGLVKRLPGTKEDRYTPLGGLHWILTTIADTIAWTSLSPQQFRRLFREDNVSASMYRNFFLAQRIMKEYDCHPQCLPALPVLSEHPLWEAWDDALTSILTELPAMLGFSHKQISSLGVDPFAAGVAQLAYRTAASASSSALAGPVPSLPSRSRAAARVAVRTALDKALRATQAAQPAPSRPLLPPASLSIMTSPAVADSTASDAMTPLATPIDRPSSPDSQRAPPDPTSPPVETPRPKTSDMEDDGPMISGACVNVASRFFDEQLRAFEEWVDTAIEARAARKTWIQGGCRGPPPLWSDPQRLDPRSVQAVSGKLGGGISRLPILLQAMVSLVDRARALRAVARFMDLGSWATSAFVRVGAFPYLYQLIQSSPTEVTPDLVFVWAKTIATDVRCQNELAARSNKAALELLASVAAGDVNDLLPVGSSLRSTLNPRLVPMRWLAAFTLARVAEGSPSSACGAALSGAEAKLCGSIASLDPRLRLWASFALSSIVRSLRSSVGEQGLPVTVESAHRHLSSTAEHDVNARLGSALDMACLALGIDPRKVPPLPPPPPLPSPPVVSASNSAAVLPSSDRATQALAQGLWDAVMHQPAITGGGEPRPEDAAAARSRDATIVEAQRQALNRSSVSPLRRKSAARKRPSSRGSSSRQSQQQRGSRPRSRGTSNGKKATSASKKEKEEIRRGHAISSMKPSVAVPMLLPALLDASPEVRASTLCSLGEYGASIVDAGPLPRLVWRARQGLLSTIQDLSQRLLRSPTSPPAEADDVQAPERFLVALRGVWESRQRETERLRVKYGPRRSRQLAAALNVVNRVCRYRGPEPSVVPLPPHVPIPKQPLDPSTMSDIAEKLAVTATAAAVLGCPDLLPPWDNGARDAAKIARQLALEWTSSVRGTPSLGGHSGEGSAAIATAAAVAYAAVAMTHSHQQESATGMGTSSRRMPLRTPPLAASNPSMYDKSPDMKPFSLGSGRGSRAGSLEGTFKGLAITVPTPDQSRRDSIESRLRAIWTALIGFGDSRGDLWLCGTGHPLAMPRGALVGRVASQALLALHPPPPKQISGSPHSPQQSLDDFAPGSSPVRPVNAFMAGRDVTGRIHDATSSNWSQGNATGERSGSVDMSITVDTQELTDGPMSMNSLGTPNFEGWGKAPSERTATFRNPSGAAATATIPSWMAGPASTDFEPSSVGSIGSGRKPASFLRAASGWKAKADTPSLLTAASASPASSVDASPLPRKDSTPRDSRDSPVFAGPRQSPPHPFLTAAFEDEQARAARSRIRSKAAAPRGHSAGEQTAEQAGDTTNLMLTLCACLSGTCCGAADLNPLVRLHAVRAITTIAFADVAVPLSPTIGELLEPVKKQESDVLARVLAPKQVPSTRQTSSLWTKEPPRVPFVAVGLAAAMLLDVDPESVLEPVQMVSSPPPRPHSGTRMLDGARKLLPASPVYRRVRKGGDGTPSSPVAPRVCPEGQLLALLFAASLGLDVALPVNPSPVRMADASPADPGVDRLAACVGGRNDVAVTLIATSRALTALSRDVQPAVRAAAGRLVLSLHRIATQAAGVALRADEGSLKAARAPSSTAWETIRSQLKCEEASSRPWEDVLVQSMTLLLRKEALIAAVAFACASAHLRVTPGSCPEPWNVELYLWSCSRVRNSLTRTNPVAAADAALAARRLEAVSTLAAEGRDPSAARYAGEVIAWADQETDASWPVDSVEVANPWGAELGSVSEGRSAASVGLAFGAHANAQARGGSPKVPLSAASTALLVKRCVERTGRGDAVAISEEVEIFANENDRSAALLSLVAGGLDPQLARLLTFEACSGQRRKSSPDPTSQDSRGEVRGAIVKAATRLLLGEELAAPAPPAVGELAVDLSALPAPRKRAGSRHMQRGRVTKGITTTAAPSSSQSEDTTTVVKRTSVADEPVDASVAKLSLGMEQVGTIDTKVLIEPQEAVSRAPSWSRRHTDEAYTRLFGFHSPESSVHGIPTDSLSLHLSMGPSSGDASPVLLRYLLVDSTYRWLDAHATAEVGLSPRGSDPERWMMEQASPPSSPVMTSRADTEALNADSKASSATVALSAAAVTAVAAGSGGDDLADKGYGKIRVDTPVLSLVSPPRMRSMALRGLLVAAVQAAVSSGELLALAGKPWGLREVSRAPDDEEDDSSDGEELTLDEAWRLVAGDADDEADELPSTDEGSFPSARAVIPEVEMSPMLAGAVLASPWAGPQPATEHSRWVHHPLLVSAARNARLARARLLSMLVGRHNSPLVYDPPTGAPLYTAPSLATCWALLSWSDPQRVSDGTALVRWAAGSPSGPAVLLPGTNVHVFRDAAEGAWADVETQLLRVREEGGVAPLVGIRLQALNVHEPVPVKVQEETTGSRPIPLPEAGGTSSMRRSVSTGDAPSRDAAAVAPTVLHTGEAASDPEVLRAQCSLASMVVESVGRIPRATLAGLDEAEVHKASRGMKKFRQRTVLEIDSSSVLALRFHPWAPANVLVLDKQGALMVWDAERGEKLVEITPPHHGMWSAPPPVWNTGGTQWSSSIRGRGPALHSKSPSSSRVPRGRLTTLEFLNEGAAVDPEANSRCLLAVGSADGWVRILSGATPADASGEWAAASTALSANLHKWKAGGDGEVEDMEEESATRAEPLSASRCTWQGDSPQWVTMEDASSVVRAGTPANPLSWGYNGPPLSAGKLAGGEPVGVSPGNPDEVRRVSHQADRSLIGAPAESFFAAGSNRFVSPGVCVDGALSWNGPRMLSAMRVLPDVMDGVAGSGLVLTWQPWAGLLFAGGNSSVVRIWDIAREQCLSTVRTMRHSCLTSMSTAWPGNGLVMAGFGDGTVSMFDHRAPATMTCQEGGQSFFSTPESAAVKPSWDASHGLTWRALSLHGTPLLGGMASWKTPSSAGGVATVMRLGASQGFADLAGGTENERAWRKGIERAHSSWVVRVAQPRGGAWFEAVTGSIDGEVKWWDLRHSEPIRTIKAHNTALTAMAVHDWSRVVATGTSGQRVSLFGPGGGEIGSLSKDTQPRQTIKHLEGFLGQRIAPVSSLEFHPQDPVLAVGGSNNIIAIYNTPWTPRGGMGDQECTAAATRAASARAGLFTSACEASVLARRAAKVAEQRVSPPVRGEVDEERASALVRAAELAASVTMEARTFVDCAIRGLPSEAGAQWGGVLSTSLSEWRTVGDATRTAIRQEFTADARDTPTETAAERSIPASRAASSNLRSGSITSIYA